jgi:hypothetical protein
MFVLMGTFHLLAWVCVRVLNGEMKPIEAMVAVQEVP